MSKSLIVIIGLGLIGVIATTLILLNSPANKNLAVQNVNESNNNQVSPTEEPKPDLFVTAQKNSLSPNIYTLSNTKTYRVKISATDMDYHFIAPDFKIDQAISKGESATINLVGNGVGTFNFSCNTGCSGKIIVGKDDDSDN